MDPNEEQEQNYMKDNHNQQKAPLANEEVDNSQSVHNTSQFDKSNMEIMSTKDKGEIKRIVERGLMQSMQVKENPITQNFVIGKRGRPRKLDKVFKRSTRSKRKKTDQV